MPANWIIERPTRRPSPRPVVEQPRLELPLHRPAFEQAQPRQEAEASDDPERGIAIVDFYI